LHPKVDQQSGVPWRELQSALERFDRFRGQAVAGKEVADIE
jgi:hypothetical protein